MKKILYFLTCVCLFITGCQKNKTADNNRYQADVVVIGAGGAGLSSALHAYDNDVSVIVLEKMSYVGGNTTRAEGGMNAAETQFQKAQGIEDKVSAMVEDTLKGGKETNTVELVEYLASNSSDAIDWLTELDIDMSGVAQGAGATYPRMHRPNDGSKVGSVLIPGLMKHLEAKGIPVLHNTKAESILLDNNKNIIGITATKNNETITIYANAVIIASGGFGANEEIFSKYKPELKGFKTTNHPGATGDGIVMAEAVGADIILMDQIQTNPTVEVNTQTVISESVRGKGAILVNQEAKRFTSEMQTRDVLSSEILKQPEKFAYLIFDQRIMDSMKALQDNYKKGIIVKSDTIAELAENLSLDPQTFEKTLNDWNTIVKIQNDTQFNRSTGMDEDLSQAPYYAIKVAPAVHYTMGGIKIDTNASVIDTEGNIIKGLYAAGEVTGGVHGNNRLGGNAIADIIVFGSQAGKQAAEYAKTLTPLPLMLITNDSETTYRKGTLKDGVYEASSKGHLGEITLKVTIGNGNIQTIETITSEDTPALYEGALNTLIPQIIQTNSADVDTVTGATNSSNAIISIITDIIEQAK